MICIYSIYFILYCAYIVPIYADSPAVVSVFNDNVTNSLINVPDSISEMLENLMENTIIGNPRENDVNHGLVSRLDKIDPDIEADVNLTTV